MQPAPVAIDEKPPAPAAATNTTKPEAAGWNLSAFLALIWTILELKLRENDARSIQTCRRRGLTHRYEAEAVLRANARRRYLIARASTYTARRR
jgi:hypothetical protein